MNLLCTVSICAWRAVPKSFDWVANVLPIYDDDRFKKFTGMTREPFMDHLESVKVCEQFKGPDQLPVILQLAIVLTRLRCKGPNEINKRWRQVLGSGMEVLWTVLRDGYSKRFEALIVFGSVGQMVKNEGYWLKNQSMTFRSVWASSMVLITVST